MTDRLLVVPAWWFSPRALDAIPANLAALDELRAHFDVETFVWPCVRGGVAVQPDWRAIVEALVEHTDKRTHLLALGVPGIGAMVASRGLLAPSSTVASTCRQLRYALSASTTSLITLKGPSRPAVTSSSARCSRARARRRFAR